MLFLGSMNMNPSVKWAQRLKSVFVTIEVRRRIVRTHSIAGMRVEAYYMLMAAGTPSLPHPLASLYSCAVTHTTHRWPTVRIFL